MILSTDKSASQLRPMERQLPFRNTRRSPLEIINNSNIWEFGNHYLENQRKITP